MEKEEKSLFSWSFALNPENSSIQGRGKKWGGGDFPQGKKIKNPEIEELKSSFFSKATFPS